MVPRLEGETTGVVPKILHGIWSPALVLLIDDDEELMDLLTLLLEAEGYRVERAPNGQKALEMVGKSMPDLILLDMEMPVMTGLEFAREFKKRFDGDSPIVVLTVAEDARRRAESIQAQGWVRKPFEVDALLDTVSRYARAA